MHLGLSYELVTIDADTHINVMTSLLKRYPNLMMDISWRVIEDYFFSRPKKRIKYVSFLNNYSDRILPGSDFVASKSRSLRITAKNLRPLVAF